MAESTSKKKKGVVSRGEFDTLSKNVDDIVKAVGGIAQLLADNKAQTPVEVKEVKEAEKASPNKITSNPEWEDIAREIIGEPVDHTEVEYLKGGGLKFTVVVKEEFSNAPLDYIERYKTDRRSKEVGAEGEAGVRVWCELIRNNLKLKPKNQSL